MRTYAQEKGWNADELVCKPNDDSSSTPAPLRSEMFEAHTATPRTPEMDQWLQEKLLAVHKSATHSAEQDTLVSFAPTLFNAASLDPGISSSLDMFNAGDLVMLQDLTQKPELNGQRGVIVSYIPNTGRFGIRLHSAEKFEVAIKPANLVRINCSTMPTPGGC